MIKYAKIMNSKTKVCMVGIGTDDEYYKTLGMIELDVEEAYNGVWYLAGYAPKAPEGYYEKQKTAEIDRQHAADKAELMEYYFEFAITDNTEGIESIKAEYEALNAQYDAAIAAIKEGE